ncbi:MAG: acetylxylan esterase [Opitutaceae bacterium]|nr:acetylxylan esterase [Opitutaceae bacterium]
MKRGLVTALRVVLVLLLAGPVALRAAELWDMAEVRKHPLEVRAVAAPRQVPLVIAAGADWMNTGDAWVAPKGDAKTKSASAPTPRDERQLIVEELFFSLVTAAAGPSQIYCAIARPETAGDPVPVVLVFHGGGGHASPALALAAARRHPGMAAVAMDYNGQFAARKAERVTDWKIPAPTRQLALVPDLRNYPMYHYVTAARRTIDWLETQVWADASRVGCLGISNGGWVALLLAGADERVKCVTTGVSAGGVVGTAGRGAQQMRWEPAAQRPLWQANYEPLAYAARTRAAVFFQLSSNDFWFWLSGAARHLAALPEPKGWVVRPNANHGAGGPEVSDLAAPAFMRHVLLGDAPLPAVRDVRVSADGTTYTWSVTGPTPIASAVLHWSPGRTVSPARYWREFPAERAGEGWRATIPREFAALASEAFVTVDDVKQRAVSGPLLRNAGIDPATEAFSLWEYGSVWDRARGVAAWRTPSSLMPKTDFSVSDAGGLKLSPAKGGTNFCLLTNSVDLVGGAARTQAGLVVRLDGHGQPGTLKITLARDSMSEDETARSAEIRYGADVSTIQIPWAAFTSARTVPAEPWPFDGLLLEGERTDGAAVSVEAITFLPQ